MTSAGLIVIGNEVLSGKVEEENARFFIRELRSLGVTLMRVVFIRDDVDTIVADVRSMAAQFDHVLTSGGVGSTHDDVTLQAVAKAFSLPLEAHPDLVSLLEARFGDDINDSARRMSLLPKGAELLGKDELKYPLLKIKNVYVFPGVPSFLRAKFEVLKPRLAMKPFVVEQLYLSVHEHLIAESLAQVDQAFSDVEFGSYPRFDIEDYKVKITIESKSAERVHAAKAALLQRWSPEWVVRVE